MKEAGSDEDAGPFHVLRTKQLTLSRDLETVAAKLQTLKEQIGMLVSRFEATPGEALRSQVAGAQADIVRLQSVVAFVFSNSELERILF